jgi:beta-glucanase (GH16 family)
MGKNNVCLRTYLKPFFTMKFFWIAMIAAASLGCKKQYVSMRSSEGSENATSDTGYHLIWSDEFNYNGLPDSTKWSYETGFIRNSEAQFYQAGKRANSTVKKGLLTITALYDSTKRHSITSASITTKNKMSFQYGRIEMRAKMPTGSGAWPAIWTMGVNHDTIRWPGCGEIDILEWFGQAPQYVVGSIHTISTGGEDTGRITPYVPADSATLSTNFHIYAIEWDSTQIKYFYDNINYATYKASEITSAEWMPFTKPHYLLLNLAIGGTGGGTIDYSKFPFTYQIDYVRYYRKM